MTGVEYIKEKYATAGYGMTWYGTGYRFSICINRDKNETATEKGMPRAKYLGRNILNICRGRDEPRMGELENCIKNSRDRNGTAADMPAAAERET
jgi:hypothetical protein